MPRRPLQSPGAFLLQLETQGHDVVVEPRAEGLDAAGDLDFVVPVVWWRANVALTLSRNRPLKIPQCHASRRSSSRFVLMSMSDVVLVLAFVSFFLLALVRVELAGERHAETAPLELAHRALKNALFAHPPTPSLRGTQARRRVLDGASRACR